MLEKTCYTLAWVAKCLRLYMLNHTTWLISKMDPIKYIFEKPALTGSIARWQMLLSEYDIEYRSQKAIKGSVLANHLAHQPIEDFQSVHVAGYSLPYDLLTKSKVSIQFESPPHFYLSKGKVRKRIKTEKFYQIKN